MVEAEKPVTQIVVLDEEDSGLLLRKRSEDETSILMQSPEQVAKEDVPAVHKASPRKKLKKFLVCSEP